MPAVEREGAKGDRLATSRIFAAQLRSSPIRSMIDRIVRSAAEIADVPFMILGIRYDNYYELISTHGVPLNQYIERVRSNLLKPELFAREVEVADLQKRPEFSPLSIGPMSKFWRYGGNCPVRTSRALGDDGVLALSCADVKSRETGGKTISILRQHAEFISDLVWLSHQIDRRPLTADPAVVVATMLQAAVSQVDATVCVVDEYRRLLGRSEQFTTLIEGLGGESPVIGSKLGEPLLTPPTQKILENAIVAGTTKRKLPLGLTEHGMAKLDIFSFSLVELGKFALVSVFDHAGPAEATAPHARRARTKVVKSDHAADGIGPISRFLIETLVPAQRLLRRNKTSYVGVRRWRSSIRKHQIAALRALKSDVPDAFVAVIAAELAESVVAVYGSPENCVVVAVPCGHSGPGCLSERLADALAKALGIPVEAAFESGATRPGTSHPRKNGTRPKVRLTSEIRRPVILVDDVATSGDHIDEAAKLLRRSAPSVWPVVWITP